VTPAIGVPPQLVDVAATTRNCRDIRITAEATTAARPTTITQARLRVVSSTSVPADAALHTPTIAPTVMTVPIASVVQPRSASKTPRKGSNSRQIAVAAVHNHHCRSQISSVHPMASSAARPDGPSRTSVGPGRSGSTTTSWIGVAVLCSCSR
jgi:hypothetical protein